jgi:hypothetical protein
MTASTAGIITRITEARDGFHVSMALGEREERHGPYDSREIAEAAVAQLLAVLAPASPERWRDWFGLEAAHHG